MATRFAISSGNFSNTAIWDIGAVPTSSDDVYANGFAIAVDQNINAVSLRSTISNVYLPAMSIPAMTGNTQPSGTVFASTNTSTAYQAFDQIASTFWISSVINTCTIGYQFTSGKVIKKYMFYCGVVNSPPKTFTFEGSNDGTTYTVLDTVSANAAQTYVSGTLANTTSYTYYRLNVTATTTAGYAPRLDQFEMTESAGTTYGVTASGSFDVSVSRDITLSGTGGLYSANGTTGTINVTATSGTVNITSSAGLTNINVGTGRCVYINGTATVNVTGDCNQGTTATATAIKTNSTGTINYIGNITSGAQGSGNSNVLDISSVCTFNITGNVNGHANASGTISHFPIGVTGSATVNITGNLTAFLGYCLNSSGTTAFINIIGIITGSSTQPALISTNGTFTVSTPILNTNLIQAVQVTKLRLNNAYSSQWRLQDQTNANRTLYNGTGSLGMPITTDVRYGTVYGQSSEYTGALRVPNPNYVSQGVLTDNTVGTAYLSASDVWNVLTSTITTSGSIGERLKNASTVQTTGDQLASYQV